MTEQEHKRRMALGVELNYRTGSWHSIPPDDGPPKEPFYIWFGANSLESVDVSWRSAATNIHDRNDVRRRLHEGDPNIVRIHTILTRLKLMGIPVEGWI